MELFDGAVDNHSEGMFEVWCNYCSKPVSVLEILHRTDFPSVGDLTHWHHGHNIIDDAPTNWWDRHCGDQFGHHICYNENEYHSMHRCGVLDCDKEWG